jgi:hypothetical protein
MSLTDDRRDTANSSANLLVDGPEAISIALAPTGVVTVDDDQWLALNAWN